MTTYVYSQARPPVGLRQFAFRNPRFFRAVEKDALAVYVLDVSQQADAVRATYAAAGVPVLEYAAPAPVENATGALAGVDATTLKLAAAAAVTIPDDWRELPWTQQGDLEGQTLRGLASELSSAPIKNKADAIAAIEAELRVRSGAVIGAGVSDLKVDQ